MHRTIAIFSILALFALGFAVETVDAGRQASRTFQRMRHARQR